MNADEAPLLLRPMRESDVEQVMAIAASLKDAPHWRRAAYLQALNRGAAPRRIAWVAEDRRCDGVLGFAVACLLLPQAELESIAVSDKAQSHGTGRKLLSALLEEMKGFGVSEVFLEVRASNSRALDFYRSLGWAESGRRPRYYADPEEDAVLMSLTLEPV